MSEIADFLRARIAERRALAVAAKNDGEGRWSFHQQPYQPGGDPAEYDASIKRALHINANQPDAVIADCDAKLALVDEAFRYAAIIDGEWGCSHDAEDIAAGLCLETPPSDIKMLRILAQPFAGHADHKGEEWAP